MLQSATPTRKPAARRRTCKLLVLALILLTLVLALPAGASAFEPSDGARAAADGNVTGTVTNASAAGIGGINVNAIRANGSGGWEEVSQTQTAADGTYDLGGLPTGSYRIEFRDESGAGYVTQYYNDKPTLDLGDDVPVTAGATTPNIDATLAAGGNVSGTVTKPGGGGLGGINVTAFRNNGSDDWPWEEVNYTQTAANGSYDLPGLPTGAYRIEVQDDSGTYVTQYYDNKPTIEEADDVPVTVGATTPGIDATLVEAAVPTVTLKLAGLKSGAVKLGKSVMASGVVTPTSLEGSKVTLTAQIKKGSIWSKAKTGSARITAAGTYSWKYTPAKKGSYRMQAAILAIDEHAGAASKWFAFKVK